MSRKTEGSGFGCENMDRREILSAVGAAGVGTIGLSTIGTAQSDPLSGKFAEIDYALRREKLGDTSSPLTMETKEVSKDWYQSLRKAEQIREQTNFESRSYVTEVDLIPPKHGGSGPKIEVGILQNTEKTAGPELPSSQKAREEIPAEIDGVPVDVHETGSFELGCYETDYGEYVPTGAEMEAGYNDTHCTMGAPLHKDGKMYFSTCQHIFYKDDPLTRKLYNQDEDEAIGDVVDQHCRDDFVAAEPINGHEPTYSLADSNGTTTDLTIVKQFTKDALQDKIANDENLTKRGITTCETSGKIRSANGYIGYIQDGCSDRNHRLKWGKSGDFDDGDSGSIAYQQVGHDQVGVAGTCNGRDPAANGRVFGASAWWIEDNHGYTYV
ncbi:hypothetical protein NGM10_04895 [Halorussus salilacus]|uniref:hypothetical protein n=1 Tax=Halorussus salilacus TaxID=2953750 RepID=UPI00209E0D70|nr:hypothetical protein [Halorussus salilacus]USZ69076.1 hypothetical protein NGM10_04895 [Halorussus salilacus]